MNTVRGRLFATAAILAAAIPGAVATAATNTASHLPGAAEQAFNTAATAAVSKDAPNAARRLTCILHDPQRATGNRDTILRTDAWIPANDASVTVGDDLASNRSAAMRRCAQELLAPGSTPAVAIQLRSSGGNPLFNEAAYVGRLKDPDVFSGDAAGIVHTVLGHESDNSLFVDTSVLRARSLGADVEPGRRPYLSGKSDAVPSANAFTQFRARVLDDGTVAVYATERAGTPEAPGVIKKELREVVTAGGGRTPWENAWPKVKKVYDLPGAPLGSAGRNHGVGNHVRQSGQPVRR